MLGLFDTYSTVSQLRVSFLDNKSYQEIFDTVDPVRLSVKESKRATKFTVEDGTERSDHVVIELTEIQIDLILTNDIRNTFENLRQAYSENRLVNIQTKARSYPNMLILDLPHENTVELGTGISMSIRLQEWRSVSPEYGDLPQSKVTKKKQSSTVKRGQQTSVDTPKKSSVLGGWFK